MQFRSRREEVEVSVAEELGDAEGEPGALHGTQAGQCNASQLWVAALAPTSHFI